MKGEERLAWILLAFARAFSALNDMTQTYPEPVPEDLDTLGVSRREVRWAKTLGLTHRNRPVVLGRG